MKKFVNVKGVLALVLALMMVVSLVGCGPSASTPPATTPPATAGTSSTPAPESPTPAPPLDFNDPNVPTVTVMVVDADQTQRAASGLDEQDNPYSRYIFDKTGVKVNVIRVPDADYTTKAQLTLTAGDGSVDFLDLEYASKAFPIAQQGALEPINSYIADPAKYPNFAKVYNADYWNSIAFDNNQYLIAVMNPLANQASMLIRQDWLDACGLAMPKTVDDLHAAAAAFVAKNPDGANPVFAASGRKDLSNLLIGLSAAYGNPSADPQTPYQYLDKANKTIATWNTSDAARAFYTEIQKWWKEGLIDKEALVNQGSNWWDEINNGNIGIVSHQSISVGWLTSSIRSTLQSSTPLLAIVPPLSGSGYTNEYGNTEIQAADPYDMFCGFVKGSKNIDNMLKVLDWECSPEGRDFTYYGLPGIEYDVAADGTKTLTQDRAADVSFKTDYVFTQGDRSLMTDQMWADYVTMQAGNSDTDYDTTAQAVARVQAAVDYDKAQDRSAFTYWQYVIPPVEAQTTYADYSAQMTALWVQMIQGKYDASTDAGWSAYLKAVDATGYLKVLDEQTQWLLQNSPDIFN